MISVVFGKGRMGNGVSEINVLSDRNFRKTTVVNCSKNWGK